MAVDVRGVKEVALYVNPAVIRRNSDDRVAPLSPETGRSHWQESLFSWLAPEATPEPEQKAAPPPELPAEEEEQPRDLSHTWVVAAEVEVTPRIAGIADFRGSFKAPEGQRIESYRLASTRAARGQDVAAN
jgi:hypothetical protein